MQTTVQVRQRVVITGTPDEIKNVDKTGYKFVSQCPIMMSNNQVDLMQLVLERVVLEEHPSERSSAM